MEHQHTNSDPEKCESCGRPLPKEKASAPRSRTIFSISEPIGEHRHLAEMLEDINSRFQAHGFSVTPPGEKMWKFNTLHHLLYAVLTAPDKIFLSLAPMEEGA